MFCVVQFYGFSQMHACKLDYSISSLILCLTEQSHCPSVLPVYAFLPHPRLLPTTDLFMVSIQFSSATQSYPTLCNPMDCSTPGFSVHHQLPGFTQTHVHWVSDAIQPSHPLSSPSPPAFNLPQHQGLFQGVSSSHQVAKVFELQLQHQSFQWIFRTDFL